MLQNCAHIGCERDVYFIGFNFKYQIGLTSNSRRHPPRREGNVSHPSVISRIVLYGFLFLMEVIIPSVSSLSGTKTWCNTGPTAQRTNGARPARMSL